MNGFKVVKKTHFLYIKKEILCFSESNILSMTFKKKMQLQARDSFETDVTQTGSLFLQFQVWTIIFIFNEV